ncbi:glycoside hydrolase [Hymenopellis radicata]|nr:glycoside hydrolase [Hymenopellis radicata]
MFTSMLAACLLFTIFLVGKAAFPEKIYGVNLGGWLLLEPWILPDDGGQNCADCSQCIRSEFDLVRTFPDTADATFAKHWESWFNEADVEQLLGYWIVEALVNRSSEFYPVGGLAHFETRTSTIGGRRIAVILDHHALPGVQSPNQMFTGQYAFLCSSAISTDFNYLRALIWTAVMTTLSHVDPDFASVVAIEAVNEPIMDANMTPAIQVQKNFVRVVRVVEAGLGINGLFKRDATNVTAAIIEAASDASDDMLREAMLETGPILQQLGVQFSIDSLTKSFQPQDLNRIQADAALGNSPLVFGGAFHSLMGLPTEFNATDEFLFKWADAQKLAYSKGRLDQISQTAVARQWSYFTGVNEGYLTRDPAKVHDPNVCDAYMGRCSAIWIDLPA